MNTDLKCLQIETTNLCNAKCIFCVHNKLKEFGTMSDELFKKIITDAKEIDTLDRIVPMLTGEPLMDEKIIERLELINEILPKTEINLYTNCSLLDEKKIKQLSEIKNLIMFFSLNGATKERRKELMGLDDFDHAVKMIRLYETYKKPFFVMFVMFPAITGGEINLFDITWKEHKWFIPFANFAGEKYEGLGKTNCFRAISDMTVLWNGKVNLCCMDAFGKIFGDLNKQTVKEVWFSKERQEYAQAHYYNQGKTLKPCDKCT